MCGLQRKILAGLLIIGLALVGFAGMSYAAFPDKPVTVYVGYRAGGSTDVVARSFAPFFSKYLGVPVVVKNMPGAGASIALRHVYKQDPDGYTLVILMLPSYASRFLFANPSGYDLKKFTLLHGIGGGDGNGIMVPYDSKYKTFRDLLEASKKEPLTLASTTPGSNSWVLGTLLKQEAKFKNTYVTFNSGRRATMAVVGGHVSAGIASTINFHDLIREKKIIGLGVGTPTRLPYLPDVPTFVELGFPNVVSVTSSSVMAPPNLPEDRKKILVDAASKAAHDPEFDKVAKKTGFIVSPDSPEQVRKNLLDAFAQIEKIIAREKAEKK